MMTFYEEYERIVALMTFKREELDYSVLDKYRDMLEMMSRVSNSGITVYDMAERRHVFASRNFGELFRYDMDRLREEDSEYFDIHIHPDDYDEVFRHYGAAIRYCMDHPQEMCDYKVICEYRLLLDGEYVRVVEQQQMLETDGKGHPWLALSILDVSPNQAQFVRVESTMLNYRTGDIIEIPDYPEFRCRQIYLTDREKEVLGLVRDGFLSKEISDRMKISVNTVNTYRQRILEKLCVNNSHEAIACASRLGLL
ncbi:MAG: LuxR C-terminal-related transcriptional regulator [Bacteroidales bacterium]|nr:LuxR C-terminal-related transcriptional regulator [Bacteroidales bacterium]